MAWCLVKHRDNFTFTYLARSDSWYRRWKMWTDGYNDPCECNYTIVSVKMYRRVHILM